MNILFISENWKLFTYQRWNVNRANWDRDNWVVLV